MPIGSPLTGPELGGAVESIAHVVQVALTPVFLLSGIGTLLNMFNTRLSRVSDHREHINELLRGDGVEDLERVRLGVHLARLHRRTTMLDASIILGGIGGARPVPRQFAQRSHCLLAVCPARTCAGLHRMCACGIPGRQCSGLARPASGRSVAASQVTAR